MAHRGRTDWMRFLAAVLFVVVVWSLILPWLGERTVLRSEIDRQSEQGVDPGALYYTDLPVMSRVDERLKRLHCGIRRH